MNMPRMLVLGLAVLAAVAAVLVVRAMMGGGTPKAEAMLPRPEVRTVEVLVAAQALQPGQPLNPSLLRWQAWPKDSVDSTFVTHESAPNLDTALAHTVLRAPMVEGEPLATTKFVHADASGFMAATLQPGMRAVSIPITTESGAGGFILPNDRVDIIESVQVSDTPRRFQAHVILTDVRVLAMDQTYKQDKDQKVVLAKTATLELSPAQAAIVVKAQSAAPLSLALRPLGDNSKPVATARNADDEGSDGSTVRVIRFGYAPVGNNGRKE
jgi:pilus assembly protein CpaB